MDKLFLTADIKSLTIILDMKLCLSKQQFPEKALRWQHQKIQKIEGKNLALNILLFAS